MQFTPRPPGASWGPNTGGSWPGEPGRGCWQRGQAARHRIDPVGFCGSGAGTRGLPGVPVTAGSCHGATSPPLQDGCRDGETDLQTQTSSSSQLLREKPRSAATSPFSPTTFTRDFGCANPQNLSSLEEPVLDSSSRHFHRQPWVTGGESTGGEDRSWRAASASEHGSPGTSTRLPALRGCFFSINHETKEEVGAMISAITDDWSSAKWLRPLCCLGEAARSSSCGNLSAFCQGRALRCLVRKGLST